MNVPTLAEISAAANGAWPYLVSGGVILAGALAWTAYLVRRPSRRRAPDQETPKNRAGLENRLTFVVAVVAAGIAAQGMWRFFRDTLDFPVTIRIVAFAVLELVTFTCALRARRTIREADKPEDAKAGVDGVAVWVVTALSGVFSATDADKWPEAAFRLAIPLLAAWLWERGMSIERRRVRGGSAIHLRLTPERVLVWLRIAEPSGRTASEVDAHRRLTRVAKAAAKVRSLRNSDGAKFRQEMAEKKLERATLSAVVHANLGNDPERKEALASQIRFIFNALSLADVAPDSPWSVLSDSPREGDLKQVTGSPSGHRALEAPAESQVTVQVSDPSTVRVTPESLTQATPGRSGQVTPRGTAQVTPPSESPVAQVTPTKSPSSTGGAPRRTDEELIAELEAIVADHYREHPGKEIEVKPVAKRLGIGRDRARRLLAEMNVRPLRKAANQ